MKKFLLLIATLFIFTSCNGPVIDYRTNINGTRWKCFQVTRDGSYTAEMRFHFNTFTIDELEVVNLETYRNTINGTYYYDYPWIDLTSPDQNGRPLTIEAEISPNLQELYFDGLIFLRN